MSRMRFGIFLPPHHVPVGQNPTYSLQRDLFANHVVPHFKGTTRRLKANEAWTRSVRDPLAEKQWNAINAWTAKHEAERAAKSGTAG